MSDHKFLKTVGIFQDLDDAELDRVEKLARVEQFVKGQRIISEGQGGNEFFVVGKGCVAITKNVAGGRRRNLANLQPGETFGELLMFDAEPRSANAEAVEETSLAVFKVEEFRELLSRHCEMAVKIQNQIIRMLCERLRSTNNLLNEGVIWGFKTTA